MHIREWGKIKKGEVNKQLDDDCLLLHKEAFAELEQYAEDSEQKYIRFVGKSTLQVRNYVGVITTTDGTQLEILPKTSEKDLDDDALQQSRNLIWQMLDEVDRVQWIKSTDAVLRTQSEPLHEQLITRFLLTVQEILKKGIRYDYNQIQAHEKFLKGRLLLSKQINEPPQNQHLFHIEYDVFSANRAENRLIHTALEIVNTTSTSAYNKKLIREFLQYFEHIPLLHPREYSHNFKQWHVGAKDRNMSYYQPALVWVELILNRKNPFTQKGSVRGISFLLAMEDLFEKYVTSILKTELSNKYSLREQGGERKYLAEYEHIGVFQLKPDIVIYEEDEVTCILDTKWKLLDKNAQYDNEKQDFKRGISQSDMYQLYAYAKKYSCENIVLIYPQWEKFNDDFTFTTHPETFSISAFDLQNVENSINKLINIIS